MNWDLLSSKAMATVLLPPGLQILLLLIAMLLSERLRLLAQLLFLGSVLSLYALATPFVADSWMASWQPTNSLYLSNLQKGEKNAAIVVLGGGRNGRAPEYGDIDTTSAQTLERLRYAARLQQKTALPILLSGGRPYGEPTAEAVLMNDAMISDFKAAPDWLETRSRNTEENASYSLPMLRSRQISKIYLVTHAWHMPRALAAFQAADTHGELEIVAAPTGYVHAGDAHRGLLDYLPDAYAFYQSQLVLREKLGLLWMQWTR